ncbi:hypothetical protein Q3G72_032095 [Acer saccharum]|nr:hypothetical protein Q3G72_032095 [Acer saccharum]
MCRESSTIQEETHIIPRTKENLLNSTVEIHYADVGLNSAGAYINERKVIERISKRLAEESRVIRFVLHGTPRQWCDSREAVDLENIPIEEVFENLKCTRAGLTSGDVKDRLDLFGYNKLEDKKLLLLWLVLRNGRWSEEDASGLVPGDIVSIKLGDIVLADARLLEGDPLKIDQSALTGESLPVTKNPGDGVYSGSMCKQGCNNKKNDRD